MIHPIRTERDHARALARIEQIYSAREGTPELDELEVLTTLVEVYERRHYPIDPPTPVEAIKFRMDQGRLTRAELNELLGGRAKVTEVLNKTRSLSKAMVVRLHQALAIPYESLLGDVARRAPKRTIRASARGAKATASGASSQGASPSAGRPRSSRATRSRRGGR